MQNPEFLFVGDPEAFRPLLAKAVATKLGLFEFEPMDEGDLRAAIKCKDAKSLQLMDEFFRLFVECGKSCTEPESTARDAARLELIRHTDTISSPN